jgi:hypothetical protein
MVISSLCEVCVDGVHVCVDVLSVSFVFRMCLIWLQSKTPGGAEKKSS